MIRPTRGGAGLTVLREVRGAPSRLRLVAYAARRAGCAGILAAVTRTSMSRPRRAAPGLTALLASLTLEVAACRSGGGSGAGDDPALAAIQARIPPLATAEIGASPGFLAGGALYRAVRPGQAQRWLQSLPLGPDVVRDLARAGNELGFDPRVDDVAARLGLDPDVAITATLFRPLGDAAPVRALLQRGTTLPPDPFPGLTPSDVGPLPRDYDRLQPPPIPPPPPPHGVAVVDPPRPIEPTQPLQPIYQPPPPPAIAKPTADQGELARLAGTLGTHSRVHLPVKDLALALAPLRRLGDKGRAPELESLCAQLGPSELCTGSSSDLVLVRGAQGAVAIDFFMFTAGTGAAFDAERATVVKAALGAPIASLAPLSTLRGDFVAYADADALPAVHEVLSVAEAAGALRWYSEGVQRYLGEAAALAQLRDTRRLFAGARLELAVEGDTLQATFQWEPRDDQARELMTKLMTRTPAAASVPTISGLCDGSLACLRTAGLPKPAVFDELAVGLYAKPERDVQATLSASGYFGPLMVFLESWPNLIGAAQRWPGQQGGRMETAMLGQALEAVGRIEGMGGSLRSFHVNRGNPGGDFVGYMRMHGQDLTLIRSLAGLAGVRFTPVELPQVTGKVESTRIPDADVPASLYLLTDPGTVRSGDRDIEVGWAMVADSNDRVAWIMGLERSAAVAPAFYMEMPDLWQLFTTIDDAQRELNFAQAWLSGRSARLAADVIDGRLRLDFQLARSAPVAAAPAAPAAIAK